MAGKSGETRKTGAPVQAKGSMAPSAAARSKESAEMRISKKPVPSQTSPKAAGKAAAFTLNAPQATRVFVAGCFNGSDPLAFPLERNEGGHM